MPLARFVLVLTLLLVPAPAPAPAPALAADPTTKPTTAPTLDLRVADGVWGDAGRADVEAVCRSAAREMLRHYRGQPLPPIHVSRGGPVVLYERRTDKAVAMKLNVDGPFWAQVAFQFGHELCHVMCRYRAGHAGNLWFEESLCETASLFVLRRMAETWPTDAPYRNWRSFAPNLSAYADERIKASPLPKGKTLAQWYADNEAELRKTGTDRARNQIVAGVLLPLFEAEPQRWAAVAHLNDARTDKPQTLTEYLQNWHDRVDEQDRAFVRRVGKELGVELK